MIRLINDTTTASEILENLRQVKVRIEQACSRAGRDPGEVKLLLATKTVPAEKIKVALEEGVSLIGENRVQDALCKYEALKAYSVRRHMIGHLQSNKVKQALQFADLIESVDRLSLAEKLRKRLEYENRTMDVFIQVNTSNEAGKFGISPEKALDFIKTVASFERLRIKGLMTIGLFSANEEKIRRCYKKLKGIQQEAYSLNLPNTDFKELSMGMSGDLEIAIEEGATIVRVGTAIFGRRMYPDSYYWNEK